MADTIKSQCNECGRETWHDILMERSRSTTTPNDIGEPLNEHTNYQFVECRGCGNLSVRRVIISDDIPFEYVDYFPPAAIRKKPDWLDALVYTGKDIDLSAEAKSDIRGLLYEVYSAIFSRNNRLAMMGIRTIADVALSDRLTDIGGFEVKLKEAVKRGMLTADDAKYLGAAVDAGSAAAHRAYNPKRQPLLYALDIVEHLVKSQYIIGIAATHVSATTPKRQKL